MTRNPKCPECGAELGPEASPDGLCPRCLLKLAMKESKEVAARVTTTASASLPMESAGSAIGPYKLLQEIGEGGFGVVYMADQERPVRRRVALKIIKPGMDTKQVIARFESERQALALMEHPNIARVLDAGATETGRPYFVMELVKGVPITEYCDTNQLSTRERLDLFVSVCAALQHAHQKGVVHRDIKPSNVMVTLHDGQPVPKVIDFGIAKATHQRLTEKTLFTEYGQFIGTPMYMSPEQAEVSGLDIDTRSDIYSLGVLLYELLTGTTPFGAEALRRAGYGEIQRIIRETEPPRPSIRLSTLGGALTGIAAHRKTDPSGLTRLIRGDLDWIVMKALEKNRARRYASASEFAADITRHVDDEPVVARPPSTAYRLRKFVRKHRGPVAAVAAVGATIIVLGSLAMWQGIRAQRQAMRVRANGILASAAAAEDPLLKALLVFEIADLPELPGRLRIAQEAASSPLPIATFRGHGLYPPNAAAFSPDGSRVVTGSRDGTALVFRADGTGEPVVLQHEAVVHDVAFSPDGTRVVTGSGGGGAGQGFTDTGDARVWRADGSGEPIVLQRGHDNRVLSVAFSPDGTRVVTGTWDGVARVWRADGTGEPIVLRGHEDRVTNVAFSPDGGRVVTGSWDGTARVWRADGTGQPTVLRGQRRAATLSAGWPEDGVTSVAFSPDGSHVVAASRDGIVRVWRADGTGEPIVLRGHEGEVTSAAFSPDGARVFTASTDGTARVWSADGTGEPIVSPRYENHVVTAAFSPDGSRVATSSDDGTPRVWRIDGAGGPIVLRGHGGPVGVGFSADGTRVVTGSADAIRVWRVAGSGNPTVLWGSRASRFKAQSVAFSPDGDRVVLSSEDNTARVWRADGTGQPIVLRGHEGVAFSPDGKRVVTGAGTPTPLGAAEGNTGWDDDGARVWRADGSGEPIILPGEASSVAFSPDGARVATGSFNAEGTVRIWRADGTGEPVVLRGHQNHVNTVDFSPDGSRVVTAAFDGTAAVWRADGTGEPIIFRGHVDEVFSAAFSPDGTRVVSTSSDRTARVWLADDAREMVVLGGSGSWVTSAAFGPDGTRIVTASVDGTARLWRADGTGKPLVLQGHGDAVWSVDFSPDDNRVVTASSDGTARIWRVTWPALLESLRANVNACLTLEQRMRILAESSSDAWPAYAECERRFGRYPAKEQLGHDR